MKKAAPENILLVDDQPRFLAALAEGLRACDGNFSIMTAENGDRALQVLGAAPVDLVVTDIKMPVMDGFDLLRQMKKQYPHIPAIAMSSFLDPWAEAQLRALGVSRVIDKALLGDSDLREVILKGWQEVK